MNAIGLKPDQRRASAIARLNEANIATRYPEDLDQLRSNYTEEITASILTQAKEALEWIKKQF
jgi:HEPN domain-containing protein